MTKEITISPRTKVLELLEAYPELEAKLIEEIPAFDKLKNPLLRKTIARMTTLQHAAMVANIPLERLIRILREETGQEIVLEYGRIGTEEDKAPPWFNPNHIRRTLDARPMLEQGEHPVGEIMAALSQFQSDEIFHLIVSFYPAPLIEKAASLGFGHYSVQEGPELFHIYFGK